MNETISQTGILNEILLQKIFFIREMKVMLDSDLAELYGIPTKALKQAVKRNLKRFPDDFMFVCTNEEFNTLRSQSVTSNRGGARYLPMAFTEQGVAMLSSILNSERAILVNIQIIRTFVRIRAMLQASHEILGKLNAMDATLGEHDQAIVTIFEYLKELENGKQNESDLKNRKRIGFRPDEQK